MKHVVVGTAGHIDHGKTQLVKALTGIDTDRLKEEKQRGITIDLGFAHLDLPSLRISIVDVPGHEKFVKNMLAGATGIDLVLMVIAADEGVMPQTKEHLEICQILRVKGGVVAITKVDLVDKEWLEAMKEEIKEFLKGTFLQDAPIICTSVVTNEGISTLKEKLISLCKDVPTRSPKGAFRLPIDRAFIIKGFGVVVTGTVWGGSVSVGDSLELLPEGIQVRVRGLEVHGEKVNTVHAGERAAINLSGIEKKLIERGDVLASQGFFKPSDILDVSLRLLPEAKPLKNWARVRFHCGTKEAIGRVKLLDKESLSAGSKAYVRLHLEEPVVVAANDRFVIRSFSPVITIGGGEIIDPHPLRMPIKKAILAKRLKALDESPPDRRAELFITWAKEKGVSIDDLKFKLPPFVSVDEIVASLKDKKIIFVFKGLCLHKESIEELRKRILEEIESYFKDYPLRVYVPKEELIHRMKIDEKVISFLTSHLAQDGILRLSPEGISLVDKAPSISDQEKEWLEKIQRLSLSSHLKPISVKEMSEALNIPPERLKELLFLLQDRGVLVKISKDFFLHKKAYEELIEKVREFFRKKDTLTVGEFKDLTSTSRKYALPLLEHLDSIGITKRVGDVRKIKGAAKV